MAEEILRHHPEGLTLLETSFVLWGYQEGFRFHGFQETPDPLFRHSSLLRIQLPDFRLEKGYNAGDMIFLFVFTAAKSLLNKKSDGGVKVGASTPLAQDWPLQTVTVGNCWHLVPPFLRNLPILAFLL